MSDCNITDIRSEETDMTLQPQRFLDHLAAHGWTVLRTAPNSTSADAPGDAHGYGAFLAAFTDLHNANQTRWFLSTADHDGTADSAFSWCRISSNLRFGSRKLAADKCVDVPSTRVKARFGPRGSKFSEQRAVERCSAHGCYLVHSTWFLVRKVHSTWISHRKVHSSWG